MSHLMSVITIIVVINCVFGSSMYCFVAFVFIYIYIDVYVYGQTGKICVNIVWMRVSVCVCARRVACILYSNYTPSSKIPH